MSPQKHKNFLFLRLTHFVGKNCLRDEPSAGADTDLQDNVEIMSKMWQFPLKINRSGFSEKF